MQKKISMDIESVREYIISLKNVSEDMPFGDDYVCFRIANKIFAGLPLMQANTLVLKTLPSRFEELTEEFSAIEQAYHWHKKHWMQIDITGQNITEVLLKCLIEEAYKIVFEKLPKKIQKELI